MRVLNRLTWIWILLAACEGPQPAVETDVDGPRGADALGDGSHPDQPTSQPASQPASQRDSGDTMSDDDRPDASTDGALSLSDRVIDDEAPDQALDPSDLGSDAQTADVPRPPRRIELLLDAEAGLNVPDGMARLPDGRLLLANEGTSQILAFDVAALTLTPFMGRADGLIAPEEVALGPDGSVYVSDDAAGAVFRRLPDGTVVRIVSRADGFESPEGVTVRPDGTVFVADEKAHIIAAMGPDGSNLRAVAGAAEGVFAPEGLAAGRDGSVFATDDRRGGVMKIDPQDRVSVFSSVMVSPLPEGICITAAGEIYTTDNGGAASAVQRFSANGELLERIEMPVPRGSLAGLMVLPDGSIIVAVFVSRMRHELWRVSP